MKYIYFFQRNVISKKTKFYIETIFTLNSLFSFKNNKIVFFIIFNSIISFNCSIKTNNQKLMQHENDLLNKSDITHLATNEYNQTNENSSSDDNNDSEKEEELNYNSTIKNIYTDHLEKEKILKNDIINSMFEDSNKKNNKISNREPILKNDIINSILEDNKKNNKISNREQILKNDIINSILEDNKKNNKYYNKCNLCKNCHSLSNRQYWLNYSERKIKKSNNCCCKNYYKCIKYYDSSILKFYCCLCGLRLCRKNICKKEDTHYNTMSYNQAKIERDKALRTTHWLNNILGVGCKIGAFMGYYFGIGNYFSIPIIPLYTTITCCTCKSTCDTICNIRHCCHPSLPNYRSNLNDDNKECYSCCNCKGITELIVNKRKSKTSDQNYGDIEMIDNNLR